MPDAAASFAVVASLQLTGYTADTLTPANVDAFARATAAYLNLSAAAVTVANVTSLPAGAAAGNATAPPPARHRG